MQVQQSESPGMAPLLWLLPPRMRLIAWLCVGSLVLVPYAGLAGSGPGGRSTAALIRAASIRQESVPSGVTITPTAAPGARFEPLNPDLPMRPDFVAGQAVTTAISPDGTLLLILTSGYNRNAGPDGMIIPAESNEYVFIYDITGPEPLKRQVLQVPNTFVGLAWHPSGQEFYVAGGPDDNVHVYHWQGAAWAEVAVMPLGHAKLGPYDLGGLSVDNQPNAAGLAVDASGTFLVVANHENDSISVVHVPSRTKVGELDLRPGKLNAADEGKPGGAYPFWVVIKGETKAYITSQRDRQVVVVDIAGGVPHFVRRIPVGGQPNKMLLNRDQSLLFVANGNSDTVAVLDTVADTVIDEISTTAPPEMLEPLQHLKGSNPNSLALTPDERFLLVTNGGTNAVAVIELAPELRPGNDLAREQATDADAEASRQAQSDARLTRNRSASRVIGLLPTGRYPNAVSVSQDGSRLFIVNGNSNTGPNPGACRDTNSTAPGALASCTAQNQYVWQLTKAGFLSMPMPTRVELARLTMQVASNNGFLKPAATRPSKKMALLRQRIQHVIYIIKENRTYDQILGDLEKGNGDPALTLFPEPITPNHHALARQFVTLDNFLVSGQVSGDGWNWSTAARTTDYTEKTVPVSYAGRRGYSFDWQGHNRNINVGLPTVAERRALTPKIPDDPDLLPGTTDVAAPDGEGAAGAGYLWDGALRAGLTIRNYGVFGHNINQVTPTPFADNLPQIVPTKTALRDHTDIYFRGHDENNADFYLFKEWEREFDQFVASSVLPHLSFVRFPHDHFGNFGSALFGVNTPDTQMADNDYAIALLIEKVAKSPFKNTTLIFIVEDDAQDGPDHVDAHRSVAYVVGPYVKQGAVVSRRYTTVNMVRTIEDLLGIEPQGITDGLAEPMEQVFSNVLKPWDYVAIVPEVLRSTQLPLPPRSASNSLPLTKRVLAFAQPRGAAAFWERLMAGQNFAQEDQLDTPRFNRDLWAGLKGTPYPTTRHGYNLRQGRQRLLKAALQAVK